MSFFDELINETDTAKQYLLASPVIADCFEGRVSLETYVAFLSEAYHHVKHTVPLLMACGSRLDDRYEWLRPGILEYLNEEIGHEHWILDDLAECGADPERVVEQGPGPATELMVSYVYDRISRINPLSFFGMVYVLEGTSVSLATAAARIIGGELGLPKTAFRYLLSHGSVDQKHIGDFERLVNRLDRADDRTAVVHTARVVFKLYGDMFRSLPRASLGGSGPDIREVA